MALQRLYHGNSPKNRFFAANAVASAALGPIQELLCQNCVPALACLPLGAAMPTFIQEQVPRLLRHCMIRTWRLETMSGHGVQRKPSSDKFRLESAEKSRGRFSESLKKTEYDIIYWKLQ